LALHFECVRSHAHVTMGRRHADLLTKEDHDV
jgi:hypothetical protein